MSFARDDAFLYHIKSLGLVTEAQIISALQGQATSLSGGQRIALAEVFVHLGLLTPALRDNIEKKIEAERASVNMLGPYHLRRKIGEGGMGAVYLAEDKASGRKYAVKVLPKKSGRNADFVKRFQRESEAAGVLNHINIVRAFSTGEDRGYHYYVMEYVEGDTLGARLKQGTPLPLPEALALVIQIARGLKYAHELGFIHRDIKPDNVMVDGFQIAKILDLGLSKNVDDDSQSFRTVSGVALGTPHYIAPEQARGEKDIDGRADIYSLGATLYHLVTGETPFKGTSVFEIITKHLQAQLPDPRDLREDIPEHLVHVIRRMMAKKPQDRYKDCGELLEDLELVVDGRAPSSIALNAELSSVAMPRARKRPIGPTRTPKGTPERKGPRAPRSNLPLMLAGMAFLAIMGVILTVTLSGGGRRAEAPVAAQPNPKAEIPPAPPKASPETREREARYEVDAIDTLRKSGKISAEAAARQHHEIARRYSDTLIGKMMLDRLARGPEPVATIPKPGPIPDPISPAAPPPSPTPAPVLPEAAPARYPIAEEAWTKAIDLLALADPKKDAIAGQWTRRGGSLMAEGLSKIDPPGCVRLEFPYQPPEEYDFRAAFTRFEGLGDVTLILSVAGRSFTWIKDGAAGSWSAFAIIGGADPGRHVSTALTPPMKTGIPITCIVQVRRSGLRAYIDGTFVTQWATDYADMSSPSWYALRGTGTVGLGASSGRVEFQRADLLEITGQGKVLRAARAMGPPPDAARQRDAEASIKTAYKTGYASKFTADRIALAKALLEAALSETTDRAREYVLFRESRDMAIETGEIAVAESAVKEMAESFSLILVQERLALYGKLERYASTTEGAIALNQKYMDLAIEAASDDRYDEAVTAAQKGEALARGALSSGRVLRAQNLRREAMFLRDEFRRCMGPPEDPKAMGAFYCFIKGEWSRGLPFLAAHAPEPIKSLAQQDLVAPTAAEAILALGDGWLKLADAEKDAWRKGQLMGRVRHWYSLALPQARADIKVRIAPFTAWRPRLPVHAKVDPLQLEPCVLRAVNFLRAEVGAAPTYTQAEAPTPSTSDVLVLYTLLKAGVPQDDPAFTTLLTRTLDRRLAGTYETSLQAMLFEALDPVRFQWRLQQCAQTLVDAQETNGLWGYGRASNFADKVEAAESGALLPRNSDLLPAPSRLKASKKIPVRKMLPGPGQFDHSNTVFALMGLRACHEAGIALPAETVGLAQKGLRDAQVEDKASRKPGSAGWCYGGSGIGVPHKDHRPSGSMTAGGVAGLCILDYLQGGRSSWKRDPQVLRGLQWLTSNFTLTTNPGVHCPAPTEPPAPSAYYLYALERALTLHGTESLEKNDWYPQGTLMLLGMQKPDGSWLIGKSVDPKGVVDTCLVLQFLLRTTAPLPAR